MPPDLLANGYDSGLPVAQVFLIFDTDKAYQETIKVETQKDSFGNIVVYWTDIMHLHENAIYLKDNNGMVATFVKTDSGETRVPLRVLYNRDPLTIIVHKAPPDHTIVPLSKGLRIDPERTLSASTKIRKNLYRALFRTNSVPVAPVNSTGAHYDSQTATIATEKTGDSQLVKISEGLNETILLSPTMQAPARLASHMQSTALLNAQKASRTPTEYQRLPLSFSMITDSAVDPKSLPPLPDRVQVHFPRANASPASLAPHKMEPEDDPLGQYQPQQQKQEQPVISLGISPRLRFVYPRFNVKGVLQTLDRTPAITTTSTSEDGHSWPTVIEKDRWVVEGSSAPVVPAVGMAGDHGGASSTSSWSPKSQKQLFNGDSSHTSSSTTLVTPPPVMDQEPCRSDRPLPRVLIVEDNFTNRLILRTFLKKRGIVVVEAENGKIGVERFQEEVQRRRGKQGFEFVLMDLQMPIMDGNIATKQIREFEQTLVKKYGLSPGIEQMAVDGHRPFVTPCSVAGVAAPSGGYRPTIIFALTALAADKDKRLAFECGVDGYLTKPVSLKTLTSLLSGCLPENVEGMTCLADMPPVDHPEADAPRSASGSIGNSLNTNSHHSLPVPYSKRPDANVFNIPLLGATEAGKSTFVETYSERTEDAPAIFAPESLKLSQVEKQKGTDLVTSAGEFTSHLSERNEPPKVVAKELLLSTPAREKALSQQQPAQLIRVIRPGYESTRFGKTRCQGTTKLGVQCKWEMDCQNHGGNNIVVTLKAALAGRDGSLCRGVTKAMTLCKNQARSCKDHGHLGEQEIIKIEVPPHKTEDKEPSLSTPASETALSQQQPAQLIRVIRPGYESTRFGKTRCQGTTELGVQCKWEMDCKYHPESNIVVDESCGGQVSVTSSCEGPLSNEHMTQSL